MNTNMADKALKLKQDANKQATFALLLTLVAILVLLVNVVLVTFVWLKPTYSETIFHQMDFQMQEMNNPSTTPQPVRMVATAVRKRIRIKATAKSNFSCRWRMYSEGISNLIGSATADDDDYIGRVMELVPAPEEDDVIALMVSGSVRAHLSRIYTHYSNWKTAREFELLTDSSNGTGFEWQSLNATLGYKIPNGVISVGNSSLVNYSGPLYICRAVSNETYIVGMINPMESHDPDDDRVVRHCQTFDHEMHSSFQVLVVADKEFRRRHRFHDCRPEETGATSATTTSTTTIPTTTTPTTPTTTTTEQPTTATTGTAACSWEKYSTGASNSLVYDETNPSNYIGRVGHHNYIDPKSLLKLQPAGSIIDGVLHSYHSGTLKETDIDVLTHNGDGSSFQWVYRNSTTEHTIPQGAVTSGKYSDPEIADLNGNVYICRAKRDQVLLIGTVNLLGSVKNICEVAGSSQSTFEILVIKDKELQKRNASYSCKND